MLLERIKQGDIVRGWHESGAAKGHEPIYFKVQRLGKVKVRVRCETGSEGWMYPAAFDKVVTAEQVRFVEWK